MRNLQGFPNLTDDPIVAAHGDTCAGSRDASDATVHAMLQEACAVHPELRDEEISMRPYGPVIAGLTMQDMRRDTYQHLKADVALYVHSVSEIVRRRAACGVCRGAYSLLCHACKGGVGS